jgi:iron uptake system EfeUOB component EfeO/EfeM
MEVNLMKITTLLVTLILLFTFAITGCGSKGATIDKKETTAAKTAQSATDKTSSDITVKEGLAKLLKNARQLRKAAIAGDEAKVKEYGPKLEEAWSKIEDDIKPKYPEIYDQVEKSLNPIVAGTKASSFDKDAILKLDEQLIQVLYDLAQKLIPVDQVKASATQLISLTNDLKKAIDGGDEVKIKEIGPKLEDIWSTFEDGVKPRNADLYEEIEKSLNPEVAGSQKSPIDKQLLGKLNDDLTQSLTKLVQSLK